MSQLLTLFITPVLYLYMDRLSARATRVYGWFRGQRKTSLEPAIRPEPSVVYREAAE